MSRLTNLSLAHRTVVILLALMAMGVGVYSATALEQEIIPGSGTPQGSIVAVYAGASPETVESDVSKPIETAVEAVDGVTSVTSTSSSNLSQTTVEWEYGEDTDQITSDIRSAVDGIAADLPDDVEPQVAAGGFDDIPVLVLAVASDMDAATLTDEANDTIIPELKKVDGVKDVTLSGGEEHEVDIFFDPDKMHAAGVDPASVSQMLSANSKAFPSGTIRTDAANVDVETGRTYSSIEEIESLELQGEDDAFPLSDLATVTERPVDATTVSRVNGRPSLTLSVTKSTGANTVEVAHDVQAASAELAKKLGDDTEITTVFDQSPTIEQSIHDLAVEGVMGLAMALLVILLFLRAAGPTLISAISIPISLLVALIVLWLTDNTLNIFTLGALTVAIGRVVDDSIVVIENIKRHQGRGEYGAASVVNAVREVAGAVTSSTLTTMAVFAPIGLVSGQAGELFRPFALTVVVALAASLVVSLTVVPVLASWFMRGPGSRTTVTAEAVVHDDKDGALQRAYLPILRWAIHHRLVTLSLAFAVFAGTLALTPLLKTSFLASMGDDTLQITQTLPTGSGLGRTDAAAQDVERVLAADTDIKSYSTSIAGSSSVIFGGQTDTNEVTYQVTLKPDADSERAAKRIRSELAAADVVGALDVAVGESQTSSEVKMYIESPNQDRLAQANEEALAMLKEVKGLTNIESDLSETRANMSIEVNKRVAGKLGMTQADIGGAVARSIRGENVGTLTRDDTTMDIYLRTKVPAKTLGDLRRVELPVTQKMTSDAREAASDAVTARQDAWQAENDEDDEDDYEDQRSDLKKQRKASERDAKEIASQLADAKKRLASLERQLKESREEQTSDGVSEKTLDLTEAVRRATEQVAELNQAVSSAHAQAGSADDQLESLDDQYESQTKNQDEQDAFSDEREDAQDVQAAAVLLGDVASVEMTQAPSAITRVDGARAVTITATSEGDDLSATTAAVKAGIK
ncbi:MAG TPA: efflux RND transporter permease subunit, partial [Marmoricola sp.]|nr:efflux RND transporter permease subunit [Marmoricola sp.]